MISLIAFERSSPNTFTKKKKPSAIIQWHRKEQHNERDYIYLFNYFII